MVDIGSQRRQFHLMYMTKMAPMHSSSGVIILTSTTVIIGIIYIWSEAVFWVLFDINHVLALNRF